MTLKASAIMKRRQPFTCLNGRRNRKRRQKGPDDQPRGEHATPNSAAAFERESASKRKNAVGGRCKALKRLNSAKELRGFNLDFVPPDLEFVPSGLDFLPKNLDFLRRPGAASFTQSSLMTGSRRGSATATLRTSSAIGARASYPNRAMGL